MSPPFDEELTTPEEEIDEDVTAPSNNNKQEPMEKFLVSKNNAEKM